jgi:saccharopine dehydrogenase-like NADP-dependent oxidoreductase
MKILLLGVGLQGKAALYDLVRNSQVEQVIAADINDVDLSAYVSSLPTNKVVPVHLDVRDEDHVANLMKSVQAVIVLLTSALNIPMARLAISQGIHFVETSYATPEHKILGLEALEKKIAILPEFGLDPGIDLVLAGQAIQEFDQVHELHAYGSGVPEPVATGNPLKYKVSWTFAGVLRAYQRPARLLTDGQVLELPAEKIFASENCHIVDVEGFGPMEAYPNGDAVRFLETMGIEDTIQEAGRYTLRWPEHCAFWEKMVGLGFLDERPIQIENAAVIPRQFVHDLLLPQLQYQDNERDIVIVRVDARGIKAGRKKRVIYQVIDWRDLDTGLFAMQRTVGFMASIGAQMILRGDIQKRGLLSPITDVPVDVLFDELQERGITITQQELEW